MTYRTVPLLKLTFLAKLRITLYSEQEEIGAMPLFSPITWVIWINDDSMKILTVIHATELDKWPIH